MHIVFRMPYQYIKEPEHLKHFVSKTTTPQKIQM